MTKPLTITDMLHGCEIGQIQSAGLMQVIPLLSDLADDNFASPKQARIGTRGYGELEFKNKSEKILLIPCHASYVVKGRAQDHAMAHSGLVEANKDHVFNTAMCIQQSQSGLIKSGDYSMLILPYALREKALINRARQEYNKLWEAISAFNASMGLPNQGNLVEFLTKFEQDLQNFVAEFEVLPRQVGVIVLIDGAVVGFERSPSAAYFESIWQALIRECYGSHALEVAHHKLQQGQPLLDPKIALNRQNINSLDDLERALQQLRQEQEQVAKSKVRDLLSDAFKESAESKLDQYSLITVENDQFIGQILRHSLEHIPYASLVTKAQWAKNKEWKEAPAFSI